MVLACSFAFAAEGEMVFANALNSYASELKDSVELSGKLSATYDYDFLKSKGSFGKNAKFAYFDLNATKVFATGAGSAKGEGAIYAAVNAQLTFSWDFAAVVKGSEKATDKQWDGKTKVDGDTWEISGADILSFGAGNNDGWNALTAKLEVTEAYIAKDGAWTLNLMKSDTGLDYAKSALSTMNEYYDFGSYNLEDTKKVALTMLNPVTKHTGVILTTEGNPYLAEISFGMSGKDNVETNTTATTKGLFNLLVKSQEVAVDNVTLSAGAMLATDDDYNEEETPELTASYLDFAAGLKIAYADDVVTADAAADFLVQDLEGVAANEDLNKKFDADVAFNFAAAGVKFNFYYATTASYKADKDYTLYEGKGTTLKPYKDATAPVLTKYAEAKLAYAFNYADVDFELGVKATDLNYASRKFSFVGTAANDVFTFGAEIGYVPGETTDPYVRKPEVLPEGKDADDYKVTKTVTGDFDLTYTADFFNIAADFEFSHELESTADDATNWGLALKIQSDKIVDGANFGLKYTRATADLTDIVEIGKGVSKATAFVEIAF